MFLKRHCVLNKNWLNKISRRLNKLKDRLNPAFAFEFVLRFTIKTRVADYCLADKVIDYLDIISF